MSYVPVTYYKVRCDGCGRVLAHPSGGESVFPPRRRADVNAVHSNWKIGDGRHECFGCWFGKERR